MGPTGAWMGVPSGYRRVVQRAAIAVIGARAGLARHHLGASARGWYTTSQPHNQLLAASPSTGPSTPAPTCVPPHGGFVHAHKFGWWRRGRETPGLSSRACRAREGVTGTGAWAGVATVPFHQFPVLRDHSRFLATIPGFWRPFPVFGDHSRFLATIPGF